MERRTFIYNKDTYNAYDAQRIVFEDGNKRGNAKSIIGLLSMKFLKGDEYTVLAEGPDARAAAKGLADFISKL